MKPRRPTFSRHGRRGMIFVTALGVVVILSGLLLVFAQNMRTEAIGSINRTSAIQADAIEQGAEQWVLAQIDLNGSDALTITEIPAEARQVGSGYFYILHPDPDTDQNYGFGITDESSKVNLNLATSDPASTGTLTLLNLPGMTNDVADSIVAWRSPANAPLPNNNGAKSDYYESLQPQPYQAKNAPFETVEELLLVKDMSKDPPDGSQVSLFGYDLNRDGVIDADEAKIGGMATAFNSVGSDSRGLFNYITVYNVEPNTTSTGQARINVSDRDTSKLQKALAAALPAKRVTEIMAKLAPLYTPAGGGGTRGPTGKTPAPTPAPAANAIIFANIGAFYLASGMTSSEFALVADQLTASTAKTLPGLVNVNTASKQALMCLPQLLEADADALIAKRNNGANTGSIAWIFDALTTPKTAAAIAGLVTTRSFQYSADIVAVSGDGRAFKRVRIVVDATQLPSKIIYRRDLTSLGWPLPREIRDGLRSGQYQPQPGMYSGMNNMSSSSLTGVH